MIGQAWQRALVGCLFALACGARGIAAADEPQAVDYAIVVTGGELLAGAYADGHTHFLTRTLRPLGLRCVGSMCVDDRKDDIVAAIRFAAKRGPLVLVTGGLGPTDNDLTREALADFSGQELREDPQALAELEQRLQMPRDRLRPNLRGQARIPAGGKYLKNAHGTAMGLVIDTGPSVVVALPGPPRELQPMVRAELIPYLASRFQTSLPGRTLTLRFVGLGQSQIDQTLDEHVPLPTDIVVSSQFEGSRVDFTFALPGHTAGDEARLDALKAKIVAQLGDHIYTDDATTTLEQHVARRLQDRGEMLTLVEVGSGGALASQLADAPTGPAVLAGSFFAPSEERLCRLLGVAVDPPGDQPLAARLERLATRAAELAPRSWTLVVGPADGGSAGTAATVQIVLRSPQSAVERREFPIRGSDAEAHAALATGLLDYLRRKLRD